MDKKEPIPSPYLPGAENKWALGNQIREAIGKELKGRACIMVVVDAPIPCRDGDECKGHRMEGFTFNIDPRSVTDTLEEAIEQIFKQGNNFNL